MFKLLLREPAEPSMLVPAEEGSTHTFISTWFKKQLFFPSSLLAVYSLKSSFLFLKYQISAFPLSDHLILLHSQFFPLPPVLLFLTPSALFNSTKAHSAETSGWTFGDEMSHLLKCPSYSFPEPLSVTKRWLDLLLLTLKSLNLPILTHLSRSFSFSLQCHFFFSTFSKARFLNAETKPQLLITLK